MKYKKEISFVIPLYNEEGNLRKLHQKIKKETYDLETEIIFVDDGSTDDSLDVISKIIKKDNHVKAISFRKNFGKSAAYMAGFGAAKGKIIITMDADLQDNPREIRKFIKQIKKGYDLVVGWKKIRHDPPSKKIPSKIFNWFLSKSTGIKLHDIDCGFRAMRYKAAKELNLYGTLYRFIPIFLNQKGFKVSEVIVKHQARTSGRSKFGIKRLFAGLFDYFTILYFNRYLEKPMHFFGLIGLFLSLLGLVIAIYLVILRLFFNELLINRPLFLVSLISIIIGVQFFSLGLITEFILSQKKKETVNYSVKKKINLKNGDS